MSGLIDWEQRCSLCGRACHRRCVAPASSARGRHRAGRRIPRNVARPARTASEGRQGGERRRC
ncbi:hypothetical protein [Cupriavidus sp. IDO]|uniref:hypothetical protein n=1 Tax=Cupriavidus sp. IDO TaxID=1539142 RepID=UPI0009E4F210|nr:hypothetical protein [Cupriavidus sp. IDO]